MLAPTEDELVLNSGRSWDRVAIDIGDHGVWISKSDRCVIIELIFDLEDTGCPTNFQNDGELLWILNGVLQELLLSVSKYS